MPTTMTEIEQAARDYAANARALRDEQEAFDKRVDEIKEEYIGKIMNLAKKAAESKQLLLTIISDAQELFQKPKTQTISGVKVGFIKQKGKLEVPNMEATIRILRSDYKDIAAAAIRVKEDIVKEVLGSLPGDDLKKLGVTITADMDKAVAALTDGALEKMINKVIDEQMKLAE